MYSTTHSPSQSTQRVVKNYRTDWVWLTARSASQCIGKTSETRSINIWCTCPILCYCVLKAPDVLCLLIFLFHQQCSRWNLGSPVPLVIFLCLNWKKTFGGVCIGVRFVWAGCPSCHPTNSVRALNGTWCSVLWAELKYWPQSEKSPTDLTFAWLSARLLTERASLSLHQLSDVTALSDTLHQLFMLPSK